MYAQYQAHKTVFPPTPSDIEGPFYKSNAPFKNSLDTNSDLHLHGQIFDTDGNSLDGVLDFWQANAAGEYDMNGYNYRCKVQTIGGSYTLDTIEPGDYAIGPNEYRCAHIHVKVNVSGFKPLTTQLYFANDKYNATDHWFNPKMIVGKPDGNFDFVLERL